MKHSHGMSLLFAAALILGGCASNTTDTSFAETSETQSAMANASKADDENAKIDGNQKRTEFVIDKETFKEKVAKTLGSSVKLTDDYTQTDSGAYRLAITDTLSMDVDPAEDSDGIACVRFNTKNTDDIAMIMKVYELFEGFDDRLQGTAMVKMYAQFDEKHEAKPPVTASAIGSRLQFTQSLLVDNDQLHFQFELAPTGKIDEAAYMGYVPISAQLNFDNLLSHQK